MSSIFKKIIDKEIPADIVYEDDLCLAFKDIAPRKPVHLLMIPKKEITSLAHLTKEDNEVISHMILKISDVAHAFGIKDTGFRVITNIGTQGGQEVPHLHFHILGGEQLGPIC